MYMKKYLAIAAIAALVGFVSCTKDGGSAKISVSPKSVTFTGEAGTMKVSVKTKSSSYTATEDADWLEVSVKGKEITLTATANTTGAERTCKVKVADANSSCDLEVIQQVGSPVPGFAPLKSAEIEYGGSMMFVTYVNETKGGTSYCTFEDYDGNKLSIWLFTEMWESEDEVELTEGVYKAGKDVGMTWYAEPGTWFPGSLVVRENSDADDEDASMVFGSSFIANDGTVSYLKTGTIEVSGNIIKIDLKDESGNEYKYAYQGDIEIDITAQFGGAGDPTADIYKVTCGKIAENEGVSNMCLTIYAGDQEAPTRTLIYFNIATPADGNYTADSIVGMYMAPSEDAPAGSVGTVDLGYYVELGGFKMAMGSSVIDASFNMWAADGDAMLMIVKNEDGSYTVMGRLSDKEAVAAAAKDEIGGTSYAYMVMGTTIEMESSESGDDED